MDTVTKESLLAELENNTTELLQALDSFSQEQFNTIPFEGSWTAGQVAEHLLKAESGIPMLFKGKLEPAERPADEKIGTIGSIFLDFETKMKSPDLILPSEETKDTEVFISGFKKNRIAVTEIVLATDLSKVVVDIPFPGMGTFTGLEWLFFMICHSKRHTRQLKNIYATVNENK